MKKIVMVLIVLLFGSQSFAEIKHRRAESVISVKSLEFLQGGIILRIDARRAERDEVRFWIYDEFWVSRNVRDEDVEKFITEKSRAIKTDIDKLLEEYRTKVLIDTTASVTIKDLVKRIEILERKVK